MARNKSVQNCITCGRDTTSLSAICGHCFGRRPAGGGRGRKGLSTNFLYAKSAFQVLEDEREDISKHRQAYHGDTIRDDL